MRKQCKRTLQTDDVDQTHSSKSTPRLCCPRRIADGVPGSQRVAKSMPRFDSPYRVIRAGHAASTYTLELPPTHKMFHVSQYAHSYPTM
ncbi:hypothetical protein OG21DRAFT_1509086 [Imleria badia]|nr:hypothetical protein OG21DRAFT_1509086 [Imleria badia]